jgi:pimeloyl-ACP methyl ester carboxylesterase
MRGVAVDDSLRSDNEVAIRAFRELILTDLMPELSKITVPMAVLYVYPKGAPVSETRLDAYYKLAYSRVKGATLKRIPDSAHFIMWDQPERFQSEVRAFLTAN